MTCYHRHLTELFATLDVPYDAAGRGRVHAAILEVLHLPADAHCPEVWGGLKAVYGPRPGDAPQLVRDVAAALPAG